MLKNYSDGTLANYQDIADSFSGVDQLKLTEFLDYQLRLAYFDARKHKRNTIDESRFEINSDENLLRLRQAIMLRKFVPQRGIAFIHKNNVVREIFAAPFRDRIVHHFLFNMSADWWDRRFIYDSYSCRKGKGTLFGIERLQHHLRQATLGSRQEAIIFKGDLKGYFMSLPRTGLYDRVKNGLAMQYKDNRPMYELCAYLWRQIIFDDPTVDVTIRGRNTDWKMLPDSKSLFKQPPGRGIVIGNLTSQLLSNIYLDTFDRYVTLTLGYKHYGRYVDDFYIVVPASELEKLKSDIPLIRNFLSNMSLLLHPKKCRYFHSREGIPFIGAVVHPNYLYPTNRCIKNFIKCTNKINNGMPPLSSFQSYSGHFSHFSAYQLESTIMEKIGWDYF